MSKLGVFFFILFLGALAVFAIFNQESTIIKVPFGKIYEMPTIALLLLSGAIGAFAMLFVFIIRDTKRFVNTWQYQKKQKREEKVQELYTKALNYLFSYHNIHEAKNAFQQVLAVDPEHLNALLKLGDIATTEEDYQTAREYYQKVRDLYPKNIDVLFAIVRLMEKTDRLTEALKYIDEILEIDDGNLNALYKKREILEKLERWQELVDVQKVILKNEYSEKDKKIARDDLVGYKYEYGRSCLENGELEKAKKAFRTVLRLEKIFIPATLGLAEVFLRENEVEKAIEILETNYEQTSSLIVLLRLEDLLISVGEPYRLIKIYNNNISKSPQKTITKFFLGRLYYRLEMIDDAFETLLTIDTAGVVYPELHQLLGNLYMKRNQIDKAVLEYKKALESHKCAFSISYNCTNCGYASVDWTGRCPNCKKWSTYHLNLLHS